MSNPEDKVVKDLQAKTEASHKQFREDEAKRKLRKETLNILEDGTGEASMSKEERASRRSEVKNKTVKADQVKLVLAAREKKPAKK